MPQHELFNCADSAALLIKDFGNCGIAKFAVTSSCRSLSVTKKSCATGYYRWFQLSIFSIWSYISSFGHEIGHNFGADHNPEEYTSPSGYNYGHLILVRISQFKHLKTERYLFSQLGTLRTLVTGQFWATTLLDTGTVWTTTATQTSFFQQQGQQQGWWDCPTMPRLSARTGGN